MAQSTTPEVTTETPSLQSPAPADNLQRPQAEEKVTIPPSLDATTDPATTESQAASGTSTVTPATEAAGSDEAVAKPPVDTLAAAADRARSFLIDGGPSIWAIAALSVITVALILWKIWRFILAGAWSRRMSNRAVTAWETGDTRIALDIIRTRRGIRSRLARAAMQARINYEDSAAREDVARVAKNLIAKQENGLRALELIATIAPLLGLLGTVMGMISAFQALQEAGSSADPSLLAGGIWEALLTTAAGMAVAIPASAALTWCEATIDSIRRDIEDLAARIFIAPLPVTVAESSRKLAAE
ncbi:MotA/TolQ/ExbB proton channel family protein [Sulfitobacter sp. BDSS02]|nr:MotA/TolQ/ExbB proton channel family protein [Sulfitobacter sp. BDSS02]MBR9852083.1 MotA/TolQ/ExbB proton channel family protein [Paracoccaceae bacterium]